MEKIQISWINPYGNDKFSNLKSLDLQDLIVNIENFYLIYRETLGLDDDVTFGIEIEYEGLSKSKVEDFFNKESIEWISKGDASLTNGGEINTSIMTDTKENWETLQRVCKYLKSNNINTCGNAGGHIHMGAHILGTNIQYWKNFLLIYLTYEHVLFRFLYGDKINAREKIIKYAKPIRESLITFLKTCEFKRIGSIILYDSLRNKHQAINFNHAIGYRSDEKQLGNTIEFRSPNSTDEEVIYQNNINALTKLLLAAKSKNLDIDYVKYQLENQKDFNSEYYNEVCLKDALEFVDIVFTNNLDKVYFLRQYLKDLEVYHKRKSATLARRFIK